MTGRARYDPSTSWHLDRGRHADPGRQTLATVITTIVITVQDRKRAAADLATERQLADGRLREERDHAEDVRQERSLGTPFLVPSRDTTATNSAGRRSALSSMGHSLTRHS